MSSSVALGILATGLGLLAGCTVFPNQFKAQSPSLLVVNASPSAVDVLERYTPAPVRQRPWPMDVRYTEPGGVTHLPLYWQDPFEDKGATYANHLGWEDYIAMPYSLARFIINTIGFPVSVVVTPPWQLQESDGELSRQLLGYDHDPRNISWAYADAKHRFALSRQEPGAPVEIGHYPDLRVDDFSTLPETYVKPEPSSTNRIERELRAERRPTVREAVTPPASAPAVEERRSSDQADEETPQ